MNFKKTVISLFAAGAVLAGGLGTMVSAQTATTRGNVSVRDDGKFDVKFCSAEGLARANVNLGRHGVTSSQGAEAEGSLVICYLDNQSSRGTFTTYLSADDFSDGADGTIGKGNLKPTTIHNVGQGQWGAGVGNIGGRTATGSAVNSKTGDQRWGDKTFADSPLYVGYGNAGKGTASDMYIDEGYDVDARSSAGSWAVIDLELKVPAGTRAGEYTNEFRVDVNLGETP